MQPQIAPRIGRSVAFTCDTDGASKLNKLAGRKYNIGDQVAGAITRVVDNNACNLTLFPDGIEEVLAMPHVPFSSGNQPGTWNYAEATGITEAQAAA